MQSLEALGFIVLHSGFQRQASPSAHSEAEALTMVGSFWRLHAQPRHGICGHSCLCSPSILPSLKMDHEPGYLSISSGRKGTLDESVSGYVLNELVGHSQVLKV